MSNGSSAPDTGKIMTGVYLFAALLAIFVIYKILAGIGLIKTKKKKLADLKKETAMNEFRTIPYFNPSYKDSHSFTPIGVNAASLYADHLRKAIRGMGTNEELIYTTFAGLKCKGNISEVSNQYYLRYNRDLRTDLLNDLNEKEITKLYDIILKLSEI